MRFLEGGTELVDPEAALGQTSRAREDELGQERAPVGLDDDAVVRIFHLDVAGVHRCLLFFFFFTLSFSILLGRKDACAGRSREWLFVSGSARGAHLLQAAKRNYMFFFELL
jgi:hypothetical protein